MQPTNEKENHRRQIRLFLQLALKLKPGQKTGTVLIRKNIQREGKKKNTKKQLFR